MSAEQKIQEVLDAVNRMIAETEKQTALLDKIAWLLSARRW
jgi:restriction endonuclease S subunit